MNHLFNEDNDVEFKGTRSISEILDIVISIRDKMEKWPKCSLADELSSGIERTISSITGKYREYLPFMAIEPYAYDLINVKELESLVYSIDVYTLIDMSVKLNDIQKECYITALETHNKSEFYEVVDEYTKKLNAFLHTLDKLANGTILFEHDNKTYKVKLVPHAAIDKSAFKNSEEYGLTEEFNVKSVLAQAIEVAADYEKMKKAGVNELTTEISVSLDTITDNDREVWLTDTDYELLSILFSYYTLSKSDVLRIANVIEHYNLFVDDRRAIYDMMSGYSEGSDSTLRDIRSILEDYYFNLSTDYYDDYTSYCDVLNITPEPILSFRSLSELIKTTNNYSDEVPPMYRSQEPRKFSSERKRQTFELRKFEKEFAETQKMVALLKERHAKEWADIFSNIDD